MAEDREAWIKKQNLTPIIESLFPGLLQRKDYQAEFEQRLYERWKGPLDLFEITLCLGQEVAARFSQFTRPYAAKQQDFVFDILVRLHIRACETGSAILSLLKSGHADNALAQARTLHELHVTAKFINMHGNDTAKRYRFYEVVESLKAARDYEKHYSKLGLEPPDPDNIPILEQLVARYKTNFGEAFAKRVTSGFYGWALEDLKLKGNKPPTFEDIEDAVGLAYMRPYYKMASYPVHASPKGLTFTVGKIGSQDFMPAGPSNSGLDEPGRMAISAFFQCATLLLSYPTYENEPALKKLHDDTWFANKVLEELMDKTKQAFLQTHQQLVEDELLIQSEEKDNPNRRFVYVWEQ